MMNEIQSKNMRPLGLEKAELRRIKDLGLKPKIFRANHLSQIIAEGAELVSHHIGVYREEFVRFFKSNPHSIVGFDIEEMSKMAKPSCNTENEEGKRPKLARFSICLMGLKISPNFNTRVAPITLKGPPSIDQNTRFEQEILKWINRYGKKAHICIHGTNQTENRLYTQFSQPHVNTQTILDRAMKQKIGQFPQGLGLNAFEQAIGFQRKYCGFIKDSHLDIQGVSRRDCAFLFPAQSIASLYLRQNSMGRRVCRICGKPQDVLMYCLEDVFVTLLIYVYYSNRGILNVITPQESVQ